MQVKQFSNGINGYELDHSQEVLGYGGPQRICEQGKGKRRLSEVETSRGKVNQCIDEARNRCKRVFSEVNELPDGHLRFFVSYFTLLHLLSRAFEGKLSIFCSSLILPRKHLSLINFYSLINCTKSVLITSKLIHSIISYFALKLD